MASTPYVRGFPHGLFLGICSSTWNLRWLSSYFRARTLRGEFPTPMESSWIRDLLWYLPNCVLTPFVAQSLPCHAQRGDYEPCEPRRQLSSSCHFSYRLSVYKVAKFSGLITHPTVFWRESNSPRVKIWKGSEITGILRSPVRLAAPGLWRHLFDNLIIAHISVAFPRQVRNDSAKVSPNCLSGLSFQSKLCCPSIDCPVRQQSTKILPQWPAQFLQESWN
jgi:hypothetical protein